MWRDSFDEDIWKVFCCWVTNLVQMWRMEMLTPNRFRESNKTDTTFIDDSWTRNIRSVASRQDTTAAAISWIVCSLMFHYCRAPSSRKCSSGIEWYKKWNCLHKSQETRKVSGSCRVNSWNRMNFEIQLKKNKFSMTKVLGGKLSQILIQLAWSDRLPQTAYKFDESPCMSLLLLAKC